MSSSTSEELARRLTADLERGFDGLADDEGSTELYQALTNTRWRRADGPEGAVALSWREAEELVNALRARRDKDPLALAQSGGEGTVSDRVERALGEHGWTHEPLDTGEHDDAHLGGIAERPPPADREPPRWEREAHAAAEANRRA